MTTDAPPPANSATVPIALDPELNARLALLRQEEEKKRKFKERVWRERRILLPVLAFVLLCFPNFQNARVVGRSMEPNLRDGDRLLLLKTYRWFAPIKVGDVVVLRPSQGKVAGEDIVKRVVFVQNAAGDARWPPTVEWNGGRIPTSYLFPGYIKEGAKVPQNHIVVLGDNLPISVDSREFGPVPQSDVIGKVIQRKAK